MFDFFPLVYLLNRTTLTNKMYQSRIWNGRHISEVEFEQLTQDWFNNKPKTPKQKH